jgi:hypothetical protein
VPAHPEFFDGRPIFHWSPVERRGQILRHGLRPAMRPATNRLPGFRADYVAFAESPSWAWALSAGMRPGEPGQWDLWQHRLDPDLVDDPSIEFLESYDSHPFHEVRFHRRVRKRDLWHVGSRGAP